MRDDADPTKPRSSTSPRAGSLWAGRLIVGIAILVFAFTLRTAVTSLVPLLTRVAADIGFGPTTIGFVAMMPTVMFGLAGFMTPPLTQRFGLERVALAAVIATGVGIAARATSGSAAMLLVWSGLALGGMGVGNIIIPPLVKRYFGDRIALLSTAYITCVQLGTAVPAALAVPVAQAHGWRVSLGMWALVPAIAVLPWISVVRARHRHDLADRTALRHGRVRGVWRSPLAWGLTVMFGMTALVTYALFAWLPVLLLDAGGSERLGGNMIALFAALGFAGTLVAPSICARFRNPFGFALVFAALLIAGMVGFLVAPLAAQYLWILLLGLGPTTFPMALTLINLRTRTDAESAALSGFTQGTGYLLACSGPVLFGVLHELTGGWAWSMGFLFAAIGALIAGAAVACRPGYLAVQA